MTRNLVVSEFHIYHRIKFRSWGHQVYANTWSPYKGEKLATYLHDQEALEYDKYAVGMYEKKDDELIK